MTRSATSPAKRLIALLLAAVLALTIGACSGDDDDDDGGSASASNSGSGSEPGDDEGDDDDGASAGEVEETEALEPEEARAEGNPEVYDRIATADCAQLVDELEAHEENAESREAQGDHRRASILRAYADETRARMEEMSCPANAGETTTTTTTTAAT